MNLIDKNSKWKSNFEIIITSLMLFIERFVKMKKVLCLCNTYAQLIIAIQLKATIKKNDYTILVLSDHSRDAKEVCENIRKIGFFDDVIFYQSKKFDQEHGSFLKAVLKTFDVAFGIPHVQTKHLEDIQFDEFVYFNVYVSTEMFFSYLYRKNPNIICSRFEEGLTSYKEIERTENMDYLPIRMRLSFTIRKLQNKRNVYDAVTKFYCYYPALYHGKAIPIQVPFITDTTCKEVVSKAFDIDYLSLNYPQKYIFFASVGDFEGEKPVGEVEIAVKVAELVGKENLLIKTHPRDRTNAFAKAGLLVDSRSTVPWEIIQLNYDFTNHVFLTVTSSSIFGINMMMPNRPKSYFLYKLCDVGGNHIVENSVSAIEQLFMEAGRLNLSNYFIANKIEDILDDTANG